MNKNIKKLTEQKNELRTEMETLLETIKKEERAFTEEENARFTELEKNIQLIVETLSAIEKSRKLEEKETEEDVQKETEKKETEEEEKRTLIAEERAFANYIRGVIEERADVNLDKTQNGAVIPTSIAKKIIEKITDISPVFKLATRYNVKGNLEIPYYDESTQSIIMDYADEFTEGKSTSGKFTTISLKGFLGRALSKVSKSLINNSDFDIVNYVIDKIGKAAAKFIEKELLHGTTNKIAGLSGVTQQVTTASATAITADELIDLQEEIPDMYLEDSIWVMSKATRKAIRKLKDSEGNYILNRDVNARWKYTLLGNEVYVSSQMNDVGAGKTAIYFGDFSGLAVKVSEDMSIDVLKEKYAEQHAVGVLAFVEIDSKVEDAQKLAKLVCKSTTTTS